MSPAPPPVLAPGATIAPGYTVIAHLARSNALDVYDAWSEERGTRCIAKGLRPDRAGEARLRRRLVAEGRLLRRLSHPHIVRGYEVVGEPQPLVVMETLTGQTLAHLIETSPRRLSVPEIAHLGMHMASALRYLHRAGWLHLDLKPSNVVAETGRAKLIDLSVARRPGRMPAGIGTWCYMAPEQARGGAVGPAADVWGLGAVLWEATTGELLFDDGDGEGTGSGSEPGSSGPEWIDDDTGTSDGGSGGDTLVEDDPFTYPALTAPVPPVGRFRRVPRALAELIAACLAAEPGRRPSLEAVLAALEALTGAPPGERRWA